jgi:hypothetical protein
MFRKGKGQPYALSGASQGGADMTALEGFLLGLMLASIPSVIFLACIAVQAGAESDQGDVPSLLQIAAVIA